MTVEAESGDRLGIRLMTPLNADGVAEVLPPFQG